MTELSRKKVKNPPWTREEQVLLLDLFLRHGVVGKTHPSVIELSAFLNKAEFHAAEKRSSTFRNPNGIHLKLRDLEAGRPGYAGKWASSSRMDRAIWAEYGNKLDEVSKDAKQIRAHFH